MLRLRLSPLIRYSSYNQFGQTKFKKSIESKDRGYAEHKSRTVAKSSEEEHTSVKMRAAQKLPKRAPLVKNFFIGEVDKELLGYPEVLTRDDMKKLQEEIQPLKTYFEEVVGNSSGSKSTDSSMAEIQENIKNLGIHGINVPEDFNGKNWGWSGSLMASEPETQYTDVATSLAMHRTIIDAITELGTNHQKSTFLPRMATGSLIGAEAILEYTAAEDEFFNTHAYHNQESNTWSIEGEKAFVITGPLPKNSSLLLLVIAQTTNPQLKGNEALSTTIFLVDTSNCSNIEMGDVHRTIGCEDLEIRRIKFKQSVVPEDCVLGQPYSGNYVSDIVLRSSRLRNSLVGLGLTKTMLNEITNYCIHQKQCGVLLKDMETMHMYLSRATCNIYAAESMIYLTAGIIDEFENPDVSLETAITKYFTLCSLHELTTKITTIIGGKSLVKGEKFERLFRNAMHLYTVGESMDTVALFNALIGLQYAGSRIQDTVRKSRNPLFHPGHIFSKILQNSNIDNPRSNMKLVENIHPSLGPAAQCIEHSVVRLQMCTELVLTRYGSEIIEYHNELQRISTIVSLIYSMFASTARASRSYCIGLQNADHEMLLASAICLNGHDVIKYLSTDIFNGHYVNNDNNLKRLSKKVIQSQGYFPVHPLMFNF